jgi:hypothetical protein
MCGICQLAGVHGHPCHDYDITRIDTWCTAGGVDDTPSCTGVTVRSRQVHPILVERAFITSLSGKHSGGRLSAMGTTRLLHRVLLLVLRYAGCARGHTPKPGYPSNPSSRSAAAFRRIDNAKPLGCSGQCARCCEVEGPGDCMRALNTNDAGCAHIDTRYTRFLAVHGCRPMRSNRA